MADRCQQLGHNVAFGDAGASCVRCGEFWSHEQLQALSALAPRPLPAARLGRSSSKPWLVVRLASWLWRRLTAKHYVCGCCWAPYRSDQQHRRPCGCERRADDPDSCAVHGRERRQVIDRSSQARPISMPIAGPGRPRRG